MEHPPPPVTHARFIPPIRQLTYDPNSSHWSTWALECTMTEEPTAAEPPGPRALVVVNTVWGVVERFEEEDGRSGWTCPGSTSKFDGFNTTKAKAHLSRLAAGFSINVCCHSWRKIDEAKLELLAELHAKKESQWWRNAKHDGRHFRRQLIVF